MRRKDEQVEDRERMKEEDRRGREGWEGYTLRKKNRRMGRIGYETE